MHPPLESALVSTGRLHCSVAGQKMDLQPCPPTESHAELRTYNKALQLNRHCAPSLHLMVCMGAFVCVKGCSRKYLKPWLRRSVTGPVGRRERGGGE